jgi:hypothetical protein
MDGAGFEWAAWPSGERVVSWARASALAAYLEGVLSYGDYSQRAGSIFSSTGRAAHEVRVSREECTPHAPLRRPHSLSPES